MKKLHFNYGDYTQDSWHALRGTNDPLYIDFIDKIKELTWDDYELWVFGGILEDWDTYDLDGTILGPYNPTRIKYLLDNITRIGFEMGIYPDIKYGTGLFDWKLYEATREEVTIEYCSYRGHRYNGPKLIRWASEDSDGLYKKKRKWPMNKQVMKKHSYNSPVKII